MSAAYECKFERKQILRDGIERLERLLEAEEALDAYRGRKVPSSEVGSGLASLMGGAEEKLPKIYEPYAEIVPGVKIGYEAHTGKVWAVADFQPGGHSVQSPETGFSRSAKLTIHPVFLEKQCTRWMSIEIDLNNLSGRSFDQLKVTISADFQFSNAQQGLHTNVVRATLREVHRDGNFDDADIGFFPVTTTPKISALLKSRSDMEALKFDQSSTAKVLLWLPIHGSYDFNIYGFSVELV